MKSVGIQVNGSIGIGDAIQFTSIPENYFKHFGHKVVDLQGHWVFDHNPYVLRKVQKVDEVFDMWNLHCHNKPVTAFGRNVYLTNAESHARHLGYKVVMNRPRLYKYEEYPYFDRSLVILHVKGRSHGDLPEHIVKHVLDKYKDTVQWIGQPIDWRYKIEPPPLIPTPTYWDIARVVSQARMFIGPDSGPSWIAQCYPDVLVRKVRLIPNREGLENWVPLECHRNSSHWDDRSAGIYNAYEDDVGFTWSYKRI